MDYFRISFSCITNLSLYATMWMTLLFCAHSSNFGCKLVRRCNYGTSDACTNEPSGEDIYIRHVDEYSVRTEKDVQSWDLDGWTNLMGFEEALDGFGCVVICGSCSFSPITILS